MRHVPGTDLGRYIAEHGPLEPAVAARLADQIGGALDAAGRAGLVHRDVKPANILVSTTDDGLQAYLTDFGLTRAVEDPNRHTAVGTVIGTLDYMAPEQLAGTELDHRVDVYALGCVLHQMLTGSVPFPRPSDQARMWAHYHEAPPPPSSVVAGVPPAMDDVVRRAMAKEPGARQQTAGELGRAAVAAASGAPAPEMTRVGAPSAPPGAWEDPVVVPQGAPAPGVSGPGTPPGGYGGPGTPPGGYRGPGAPGQYAATYPQSGPIPSGPYIAPPPPPPRRPGRLVLAIGLPVLLLVAAGIVAAVLYLPGGPSASTVGAPIAVGRNPLDVEEGGGFLWTANADDGTISRIDPASGDVRSYTVSGVPNALVVDAGAVWVWNYTDGVTRIDIATGTITTVDTGTPAAIGGIAAGGGFIWLTHPDDGTVSRISTATKAAAGTPVKVGKQPVWMEFDNGRLYVSNTGDRSLSVLDGVSGQQMGTPLSLSVTPGGMDIDRGTIYVATGDANAPADQATFTVTPIDQASFVVGQSFDIGRASWFAPDGDVAWIVYPLEDEVRTFDLTSREPTGREVTGVGRGVVDVLVSGDELWMTRNDTNSLVHLHIDR